MRQRRDYQRAPDKRKTARVTFRLPEKEYIEIKKIAKSEGLELSAVMRQIVKEHLLTSE